RSPQHRSFPTRRSSDLRSRSNASYTTPIPPAPRQRRTSKRAVPPKPKPRSVGGGVSGGADIRAATFYRLGSEFGILTPWSPPTADRKSTRLNSSHVAI